MKKTLVVQAQAKINIGLWVRARRNDGFHEIATLLQSVTLQDTIMLKETKEEGIRIECNHPSVPCDERNLVHKAARIVMEQYGIPSRILIQIDKRIPVAAGLAGGSSDAAAVMLGLIRMYDKSVPLPQLMELGLKVGSDVPFVMYGGLALGEGRGERLSFQDLSKPPINVVIATPRGIEIQTRWAYENCRPEDNIRKETAFSRFLPAFQKRELRTLRSIIFNDLEVVALHRYPEIGRIKDVLSSYDDCVVSMSGSGPSVFGLFGDKHTAIKATERLSAMNCQVFLEQTSKGCSR